MTMKRTRKPGRPNSGLALRETIRLSPAEKEALTRLAQKAGRNLKDHIRFQLGLKVA